jgi:hypothetical protein
MTPHHINQMAGLPIITNFHLVSSHFLPDAGLIRWSKGRSTFSKGLIIQYKHELTRAHESASMSPPLNAWVPRLAAEDRIDSARRNVVLEY